MVFGGGCCILIAFFWHYKHFNPIDFNTFGRIYYYIFSYSSLVVELFFMISGFLMYMTYGSRINNGKINFLNFTRGRYRSLWPISFVTLLVVTFGEFIYKSLSGSLFVINNFDFYHFILNVLLMQSGWFENSYSFNTPTWFISVLVLNYLLFYLIIWINRKLCLKSDWLLIIPVIVGWMCRITNCEIPFLHFGFAARGYYCFFIGAIISCSVINKDQKINKINDRFVILLLSVFIAISIALRFLAHIRYISLAYTVYMFVVLPIILVLCVRPTLFAKFWELKLWTFMGKISTDVFFWHFPLQIIIAVAFYLAHAELKVSSPAFYSFYIAIVILVSYLSSSIRGKIKNLIIKKEKNG